MRLIVHAGAGNISPDSDLLSLQAEISEALSQAVRAGQSVAEAGGSSVDVVVEAVRQLEDCELFNAGRGSVLNREGKVEMDAGLMEGRERQFGAVASVTTVRNPITAARAVLDEPAAILLCGRGADDFAAARGCAQESQEYFITDYWLGRWRASRGDEGPTLDHSARGSAKHGTVGAVALDREGNLAAATSTGGLLNKPVGRISDAAVPGAGTYAANDALAVSFTGTGEHILRLCAGVRLAEMVASGQPLRDAARAIIAEIAAIGGEAGLIAIDRTGELALTANTTHLLRGWIAEDGSIVTALSMD